MKKRKIKFKVNEKAIKRELMMELNMELIKQPFNNGSLAYVKNIYLIKTDGKSSIETK